MEVEVQRLINRHRAELEAAHEKADERVKQAVEAAKKEHEVQQQALREKLRQVRGMYQGHVAGTYRCRHPHFTSAFGESAGMFRAPVLCLSSTTEALML